MSISEKDIDAAIENFYAKFDKDKNGYLDRDELMEFISSFYKRAKKPIPSVA